MRAPVDDPQFNFVRECVLVARRWRARVDERLKPEGLTLARATVLYWIGASPEGVTQSRLAEIVGIEGPTLVRQLHALEAQGLVERVPVVNDRRAKALRLTPKAEPLIDTIIDVAGNLSRELLGGLDRRRVHSATKLARDARAALE